MQNFLNIVKKPVTMFTLFGSLLMLMVLGGCEHSVPAIEIEETETTFEFIQKNIFDVSCATAGCHLGTNAPHELDLSEGLAYGNLINVDGVLHDFPRVDPGDPDNSLLVQLVEGTLSPQMPFFAEPLSGALQDSVRAWVLEGAPEN